MKSTIKWPLERHRQIIKDFFKGKTKEALRPFVLDLLPGKTVEAFGPNGNGSWGEWDKVLKFTIHKVELENEDDPLVMNEPYDYVKIYLTNYSSMRNYGLIYTDETFENSINQFVRGYGMLDYTEQGMQGKNYVSMTFNYRKKI